MPTLWTIGYQQRALPDVLEALEADDIRRLVDVRERPYGRKPEFNQRALSEACGFAGITYDHRPALGVVKEVRDAYKQSGDWEAFSDWYQAHLQDEGIQVAAVAQAALQENTALFCLEYPPERCHRSLLAARIADAGFEVEHL